jgi:hypothetical protein
MVLRIDVAIRKQQEGTMDPITALNQEFARLVQEDWSRAAAERRSERAAPTLHKSMTDRLRTIIGTAVVAFGLRLQGQHSDPAIGHAHVSR